MYRQNSGLTEEERNFALHLKQILTEGFVTKTVRNLEFGNRGRVKRSIRKKMIVNNFNETCSLELELESSEHTQDYIRNTEKFQTITSYNKMKEILDASKDASGKLRAENARSKYQGIFKNCSSDHIILTKLKRFERYVKNHGCRRDKYRRVNEIVLQKFKKAKQEYKVVEDRDLQYWAQEASEAIKITNFKASGSWLLKFKIANRIVSRLVNRIVSTRFSREEAALESEANKFICVTNRKDQLEPAICAKGQSGFDSETHIGSTLELEGTTNVIRERNGGMNKEERNMGKASKI